MQNNSEACITDAKEKKRNVLAIKIKNGETDLIPELYSSVRPILLYYVNSRWRVYSCDSSCRVSVDRNDLEQASYFGFLRAIDAYDPAKPGAFSCCLKYGLLKEFQKELCLYTKQQRFELDAISSQTTLYENSGDDEPVTIESMIEDTRDLIGEVDAQIHLAQIRLLLDFALEELSYKQQKVLRLRYFEDICAEECGGILRMSVEEVLRAERGGLQAIRIGPYAEAILSAWNGEPSRKAGANNSAASDDDCVLSRLGAMIGELS